MKKNTCYHVTCLVAAMGMVALFLGGRTNTYGDEIHAAVAEGDLGKVKALVKEKPETLSSKGYKGLTPLHFAVWVNKTNVLEFLLANKADVNAKANNGITPLSLAAEYGQVESVKMLLGNNADVNPHDDSDFTPLIMATQNAHKEVVALLLAAKANVNATNNLGWTALHMAASRGHKDIVTLLLACKSDVNATSNVGQTPLDLTADQVKLAPGVAASLGMVITGDYDGAAELLRQHGGKFGRDLQDRNTGKTNSLNEAVPVSQSVSVSPTNTGTKH